MDWKSWIRKQGGYPSIELLVFLKLLELDSGLNSERIEDKVISFKTIRGRVGPSFSLTKDLIQLVLYRLEEIGVISVISKHGVKINE